MRLGAHVSTQGGLDKAIDRAQAMGAETVQIFGAKGSIVHIGSHRGAGLDAVFSQVVAAIRRVMANTPPETWLVLENSAGMGGSIGASFGELGAVMRELTDTRIKVCLDTQHAFAMGYDVASAGGLQATLDATATRTSARVRSVGRASG
jgi:endonuclease IV